jgi:hypothetical protein
MADTYIVEEALMLKLIERRRLTYVMKLKKTELALKEKTDFEKERKALVERAEKVEKEGKEGAEEEEGREGGKGRNVLPSLGVVAGEEGESKIGDRGRLDSSAGAISSAREENLAQVNPNPDSNPTYYPNPNLIYNPNINHNSNSNPNLNPNHNYNSGETATAGSIRNELSSLRYRPLPHFRSIRY